MKTRLLVLAISALLPVVCTASDTNGFLVFKIERQAYKTGTAPNPQIEQSFKIPLTSEFLSNFKNLPTQNSEGTGFNCNAHFDKPQNGDAGFSSWLERTSDHRWH